MKIEPFKNNHGEIEAGTIVHFSVENPSTYCGSTIGVLEHNGVDYVIKNEFGIMTINKGYDAYINTIKPLK